MDIRDSVLAAIGNTPLIKLRRASEETGCTILGKAEFEAKRDEWLPSDADRAYVRSLMKPVYEPGKMANWIATAPRAGCGAPAHRR